MLDATTQRKEALEPASDIGFDLLRRHSVIKSRHHNHRDIHGREHVYRHAGESRYANHGNQETDGQNEVRILDRKLRHRCTSLTLQAMARIDLVNFQEREQWSM